MSLISFTEAEQLFSTSEPKNKVNTPLTADSLPHENPQHDFFIEGNHLFTGDHLLSLEVSDPIEEKRKEEDVEEEEEVSSMEIDTFQKQKCNFEVVLEIEQGGCERVRFEKKIWVFKEKNESYKFIFEKQHEKEKIKLKQSSKLRVYLQDFTGFRKLISQHQCTFQIQKKKSNLQINASNLKLCFQLQNFKTPVIRFLGIQMPLTFVEDFFQYKNQLLSKSPILNQVKNLGELKGIYYQLSQQNMGSRILQKLLNKASFSQFRLIIEQLWPELSNMASHNFGNYVLQKLFERSPLELKKKLFSCISKDLITIIKSKVGTFSLQHILDLLDEQEIQQVYRILEGSEIEVCNNEYGTHFIQKLVCFRINYRFIQKIFDNFQEVACDKHGIVVLKSVMKLVSMDYNIRCLMLQSCQYNFNEIYDKEYGHYIIEDLFNYYQEYELLPILNHIAQYISFVSQNVHSSSIIKKGLDKFSQNWVINLINNLIANEGQAAQQLMETNPGSFVLHRILQHSPYNALYQIFIKALKKNAEKVKSYEKRNKWISFLEREIKI